MPRIYVTKHRTNEYTIHCPEIGVNNQLMITPRDPQAEAYRVVIARLEGHLKTLKADAPQ